MSSVVEDIDVEPYLAVVGGDLGAWGTKINHILLNLIQPKINEVIEYSTLNNYIYGGSASSVYLDSQILDGGGA